MLDKEGYIYILTNKVNSVLYIGVTSDLPKRIWKYKNEVVEGFSKKYKLHKLVYYEHLPSIENAIIREKYSKGKSRNFKENLINNFNPEWMDLYEKII